MTRGIFLKLSNSGFTVNDDYEPVTYNIPVATTVDAVADTDIGRNAIASEDWGFDGVDQWRTSGGGFFSPAKLKKIDSSSITRISILEFFLLFYLCDYTKLVLIPQTNKNLSHRDMDLYELLSLIGCWLYMACFEGVVERRMWGSNTDLNMSEGALGRLTKYTPLNRFEDILRNMSYTDNNVTAYNEKFFHMRQMEDAWNTNITNVF